MTLPDPDPDPDPGAEPDTWRPRLAPGVVLHHEAKRAKDLLLLPERVVVLEGASARIIALCDGSRSVRTIVAELLAHYPEAPVEAEATAFLHDLRRKRWMR
ncbi:pyrroloquinoline quinone biosynthesis peptide chaperone PqqD [Streptomyces sp. CBMA29]|uniref:pyrroloquinoline quinone biosynthesis peptide chaperone PqqD n=1 Tax=Streptomyces sp. CBMA29 TaxID=1896314 RepID=UPI001661E0C4|nr:pyrroloquinoline quinone biosynthesis peptide chaperone PqqD [Streptomyces sp. CBMA29]MBD0735153.1 pyrroloquinoline quinone biosynthesis protein PqqD [Streptomyces sp. CBMA29]